MWILLKPLLFSLLVRFLLTAVLLKYAVQSKKRALANSLVRQAYCGHEHAVQ